MFEAMYYRPSADVGWPEVRKSSLQSSEAEQDSMDDLCDQIRMLRTSLTEASGFGGDGLEDLPAAAGAATAAPMPRMFAGERYTPSLAASPLADVRAAPVRPHGGIAAADGFYANAPTTWAPSSASQAPRTAPAGAGAFGADSLAADSLSQTLSPLRLQHTLWEERQLQRCFDSWRRLPLASGAQTPSLEDISAIAHDVFGGEARAQAEAISEPVARSSAVPGSWQFDPPLRTAPSERVRGGPLFPEPEPMASAAAAVDVEAAATRVDLCFRVWRRLCAARRAEEIASSVRLLNAQVSRQMRRSITHWSDLSQARLARRADANLRLTMRRLALRKWGRITRESALQRSRRGHLVGAGRLRALRGATVYWASRASASLLRRAFNLRQASRRLRLAWTAWRAAREYRHKKTSDARVHAAILQGAARRAALWRWAAQTRNARRCQNLLAQRRRDATLRAKRSALRRLAALIHRRKASERNCSYVQRHGLLRRQASLLHGWARWCSKRLYRRRRLSSHVATRVRPRLVSGYFQTWLSAVRREQRHGAALQRARIVLSLSLKRRTFGSWLARSYALARAALLLRGLASSDDKVMLALLLEAWRAYIDERKRERALELRASSHHSQRLLATNLQLLRSQALAQRQETAQRSIATTHDIGRLSRRCLSMWRAGLQEQRRELTLEHRACSFEDRSAVRRSLLRWRGAVADERQLRENCAAVDLRRDATLVRSSLRTWVEYLAARRRKRPGATSRSCASATVAARRRQCLGRWNRARLAEVRRREAALALAGRTGRALFAWGAAVREERRRIQQVQELAARHLLARSLRGIGGLVRTAQLCDIRQTGGLISCVFGWWYEVLEDHRAESERKVSLGLDLQARRLAALGLVGLVTWVLERRHLRRRILALEAALEVAVEVTGWQSMAYSLEAWRAGAARDRSLDEAQLQYNQLQQKELCFQCWRRYCEQQGHKRSVHLVCGTYRDNRLLRGSFESWSALHRRNCAVAERVLVFAAGLATQGVESSLLAWRGFARRRAACRRASQDVMARRRRHVVETWRSTQQQKVGITLVLAAVMDARRRTWLRLWLAYASARQAERRRERIGADAMRNSRQRRVIDLWCEAGRWHRLGNVAETWDRRVTCKQVLKSALAAWQRLVETRRLGQVVTSRLATSRAILHLRRWHGLTTTLAVRPRSLQREMLWAWRSECRRAALLRRLARKLPLERGFARLRAHQRFQAAQKRKRDEREGFAAGAHKRSKRSDYFGWWKRWACSVQRKARAWKPPEALEQYRRRRALQIGFQMLRAKAMEARPFKERLAARAPQIAQVQERRRQRVFNRWHDSMQHRRALCFRRNREMAAWLAPDGAGYGDITAAIAAWAAYTRRRTDARASERTARTKLAALQRARFFDAWAKAYEHESSSFFAEQILQRSKLVRLVAGWLRLALYRKTLDATLAHKQVLNDTQLLRNAFQRWDKNLQEHRCIAAVWMDRWRHWSSALMTAWRRLVRQRRQQRAALAHLRCAARFRRCCGSADVLRRGRFSVLLRIGFDAMKIWVERVGVLQARAASLESRVAKQRQVRRLCSWAVCSRALEREANPCGGLPRVLAAWVAAHRVEMAKVRGVASLVFRGNAVALRSVIDLWNAQAMSRYDLRKATRSCRSFQKARRRLWGLDAWSTWACTRRRRRRGVQRLSAQRIRDLVLAVLYAWSQDTRSERAVRDAGCSRASRELRRCWRAWRSLAAVWSHRRRCGETFQNLRGAQALRELLAHWSRHAARLSRTRRLVARLERVGKRWVNEAEWRVNVVRDPVLRAMFDRFATAFDLQRGGEDVPATSRLSALSGEGVDALASLIWERQQLSVALGRLRGYPQPWVLGAWPAGTSLLLAPDSPYHAQTELRLRAMVARLERLQSPDGVSSLYSSLYAGGASSSTRVAMDSEHGVYMWQALADLMVVYHPDWTRGGAAAAAASRAAPLPGMLGRHPPMRQPLGKVPELNLSAMYAAERVAAEAKDLQTLSLPAAPPLPVLAGLPESSACVAGDDRRRRSLERLSMAAVEPRYPAQGQLALSSMMQGSYASDVPPSFGGARGQCFRDLRDIGSKYSMAPERTEVYARGGSGADAAAAAAAAAAVTGSSWSGAGSSGARTSPHFGLRSALGAGLAGSSTSAHGACPGRVVAASSGSGAIHAT
eukprot:TRINITY_DN13134_c0_g3_i1.p1 TRINITY_DN13134_c0_g3~~TRINITY_DN13134_c0_g3_i1.p1  ORF type:complete len:2173 (-),score=399.29 TRINITY_DN13134_c0_g3_i1:72-6590(-)